jgi:hypothetical protein
MKKQGICALLKLSILGLRQDLNKKIPLATLFAGKAYLC